MNRPTTALGIVAVTLALLTGCGKDNKSGSPCRDSYVEKLDQALTALEKAPPNTDFDTALGDAMGTGVPEGCEGLARGLVDDIIAQVLDESADRMTALADKFPPPTAGPEASESPDPEASESASPSEEESPSPGPSDDAGSAEEESPSPSPSAD